MGSAIQQLRLPRAPSNLALNAFRDRAPTASLGSCARASPPGEKTSEKRFFSEGQ